MTVLLAARIFAPAVAAQFQSEADVYRPLNSGIDNSAKVSAAGNRAGKIFGEIYTPVGNVSADQVQIIFYRTPTKQSGGHSSANVYIDGHFQTSLLSNGYTVFCLKPGSHTLGAYLDDSPEYKGKRINRFETILKPGMTYFLKVREDGVGVPISMSRTNAEIELRGARAQVHALSRVNTEICREVQAPAEPRYMDYILKGDVLFPFGKSSYDDINPAGREEISKLVMQMRSDGVNARKIEVVGHADQIGSDEAADKLGLQRAETVRRAIIETGVPDSQIQSRSMGNREPIVQTCRGSRREIIACYAPNRRVVVRVDMSGMEVK
ncbi:OmpA family protein [Burkholderia sp. MSMB1078WGS]|uniref:OmpA family protein n=1 Tax=Burkholderia sp. MSMB1078WGS TaxID=1637900 RepID=UPI0015CF970F|nr:OmpA family protein [Burkholderia sp. MSMB1078WGS]